MATKLVEMEAKTMIELGSHPCLVNLIDADKSTCLYKKVDPECSSGTPRYIAGREDVNYMVMERCTNGALSRFVRNTGPFEEDVARFLFTQLCSAVHFMHEQGFVHLDIKLDNILLDEFFNLKLADLGIALCARGPAHYLTHKRGTNKYMAPEVESASNKAPYDVFKADIYSLGICLHLMLVGAYPSMDMDDFNFTAEESQNKMTSDDCDMDCDEDEAVSAKLIKTNMSSECWSLLQRMIHPDPKKRPTIFEIFEDPWMNKLF